ncbi:MAG TPA: hypothetical protein VK571_02970 [Gemmatimonadaceae bacterium]|nr:hypothetical protein [Gemmatimonadaceae bacterium]
MKFCYLGILCLLLSVVTHASADTWTSLTPTTCPTSSAGLFRTGQQYLGANNGVLQDSWSMLVRWQDATKTVGPTHWTSNPLNYDAGTYTTYTPPTPYSNWQRGYQPESQAAATPGVQLHCFDAGMILNSWYTPHSGDPSGPTPQERSGIVEGGGFNDMYGYAWGAGNRPYAFKQLIAGNWVPSDLVLQGLLAVPALQTYEGTLSNGTWSWASVSDINNLNTFSGSGQLDFFAYIQDTSHPSLHPIALIAGVYGNGPSSNFQCATPPATGNIGMDYPTGVWFGSTAICNTDISTANYTGGFTSNTLSPNLTFYRIHYTTKNLRNLVSRINASTNCKSVNCYSSDPSVYTVQYIGVIAETEPCTHTIGSPVVIHCSTNLRDPNQGGYLPNKDGQIGMVAKISGVSAYAYTPN